MDIDEETKFNSFICFQNMNSLTLLALCYQIKGQIILFYENLVIYLMWLFKYLTQRSFIF